MAATAALLVAPAPPSLDADAAAGCVIPPQYEVVARSRRVVLATHREYTQSFVCDRRRGKRWSLENSVERQYFFPNPRFAGPHTAYFWNDIDANCGYFGLALVDARTGREARLDSADDCDERPSAVHVTGLVLKPGGSVAWIRNNTLFGCRRCLETAGAGGFIRNPSVLARRGSARKRALRPVHGGIAWREGTRIRRRRFP